MSASVRHSWVFAITLLLAGCVAPALLLSPQSQLMWALLKPMIGLDPNEMNLLEQPLIKNRMQPLLGEHYDTAVTLLKTADKLQQEGPLFYLVSNHTPIPQMAEKAGFVWNSETNQIAVMLVSGGAPMIFAEQLNNQAAKVVPSWPADLADYADPVKLKQKALQKASSEASTQLGLSEQQQQLTGAVLGGAKVADVAKTQLDQQKQQLINTTTAPVAAQVNAVKQQVSAVKTQVKAATDVQAVVKNSVDTQVKNQLKDVTQPALDLQTQVKEQAKTEASAKLEALAQPVTSIKTEVQTAVSSKVQSAVQQSQELKTQAQAQVHTQVEAKLKSQTESQLKAQTQALTEPVTQMTTKLKTTGDDKLNTGAQNLNMVKTAPAAVADETDLAAEMAAEQASLMQNTAQQTALADNAARLKAATTAVTKAQAEVEAAAALLAKATSPAEVATAKAKLDAASKTLAQAKALQQQLTQP